LLAELAEVMNRPKFEEILARSDTDAQRTLGELRRLAEIIDPPPLPAAVSRDPRTTRCWLSQSHRKPI
jgi:hypothetical protein